MQPTDRLAAIMASLKAQGDWEEKSDGAPGTNSGCLCDVDGRIVDSESAPRRRRSDSLIGPGGELRE